MSHVEITLTNGNLITADCDEFRVQTNTLKDGLVGVKWANSGDAKRQLMYVAVNEISAVVFVRDEETDGQLATDNMPTMLGNEVH